MGLKAEISWKGRTAAGERREVYARRVGDRWCFHQRSRRYERWAPLAEPSLDDWRELLDAVQRRIQRRLLRPEEEQRIRKAVRARFPEAELRR
jgi:hypothetical protein